jgi:hypothetical protein
VAQNPSKQNEREKQEDTIEEKRRLHRKATLGIISAQREGVRMTHSRVKDLDTNFSLLGRIDLDLFNREGSFGFPGNRSKTFDHFTNGFGFFLCGHCAGKGKQEREREEK